MIIHNSIMFSSTELLPVNQVPSFPSILTSSQYIEMKMWKVEYDNHDSSQGKVALISH